MEANPVQTPEYRFNNTRVCLLKQEYTNGRIALELYDLEEQDCYCRVTTNHPDTPIPPGHAFIKNYSENQGVYEWLLENKIVQPAPQPAGIDGALWPLVNVLI